MTHGQYEMSEIPDFGHALSDFSRFLVGQGHSGSLVWVFRDDLWFRSRDLVWVRFPPPKENRLLAESTYAQGRERGLVEIVAIATSISHFFATVWFPKNPGQEVQGWSQGLKLMMWEPLAVAKKVSFLKWLIVMRLSSYRRSQQEESFIGSRRWAAS